MGDALGDLFTNADGFKVSAAAVTDLHDRVSDDKLIIHFLRSSGARRNPQLALPLVDRVSDSAERQRLRKSLDSSSNPNDR